MNNKKETDNLATLVVFGFVGFIITGVAYQVIWPLVSDPQRLENMIERVAGIQLLKEGIIEMAGLGYGDGRHPYHD